jgi:hypothetical protein
MTMNTLTFAAVSPKTQPVASPVPDRALGALLVAEGLLAFAPLLVLGPAIGWPASLGRPAADQLTAIAAAPDAVAAGYGLYLLYSILVAPLMIGLAALLPGGLQRPLGMTVAAFGVLSALARSIGILRWLTVMPELATARSTADPAGRAVIDIVFQATTEYGGGIGELLGVSLFMALSVGLLCAVAWRSAVLPRALAALGGVSALLLGAMFVPAWRGPELVPVAAAVSLLSLWMLAAGVWLLRRRAG